MIDQWCYLPCKTTLGYFIFKTKLERKFRNLGDLVSLSFEVCCKDTFAIHEVILGGNP